MSLFHHHRESKGMAVDYCLALYLRPTPIHPGTRLCPAGLLLLKGNGG
ncbi:MAG: hypothetical protein Q6L68_01770 [Thermostichus sp. DG02_5_bins_236]